MRVAIGTGVALLAMMGCASSPKAVREGTFEGPRDAGAWSLDAGVAGADAGPGGATLFSVEALALRGPQVAAGMREVARGEVVDGAARAMAHSDERDICVRVILSAPSGARASLTDARGDVLAEVTAADAEVLLGARGPVCVRKGDTVTLHATATARFVAWASP